MILEYVNIDSHVRQTMFADLEKIKIIIRIIFSLKNINLFSYK